MQDVAKLAQWQATNTLTKSQIYRRFCIETATIHDYCKTRYLKGLLQLEFHKCICTWCPNCTYSHWDHISAIISNVLFVCLFVLFVCLVFSLLGWSHFWCNHEIDAWCRLAAAIYAAIAHIKEHTNVSGPKCTLTNDHNLSESLGIAAK